MLKDFKAFIMTGNVIEFAIAVILAGAVGLVVNSFVADMVMPVVGHFAGGIDFASKVIELDPATVNAAGEAVPANNIRWGAWINTIINLIIVGFVMFMLSKAYIKANPPAPAAPEGPSDNELLGDILKALKK